MSNERKKNLKSLFAVTCYVITHSLLFGVIFDSNRRVEQLRQELSDSKRLMNKGLPVSTEAFGHAKRYMDTCHSCSDTAGYLFLLTNSPSHQ